MERLAKMYSVDLAVLGLTDWSKEIFMVPHLAKYLIARLKLKA